jgi:hypothetical protein
VADVREQLEALIQQMVEKGVRYDSAVQDFEKGYISRVLQRVKGNQSRAARMLGMHRNTLSRKIGEYNLVVDALRNAQANSQTNTQAKPIGRATQAAAATAAGLAKGGYGRR